MDVQRPINWLIAISTILVIINVRLSFSCSCLPAHPQTQFCNSDFVLMVKVRARKFNDTDNTVAYHVAIKKIFKMSDKTSMALKSKIIWSSQDDGMCGVKLKPNSKYLITGRTHHNKAMISLCNYQELWSALTTKQKKGFRLLYKQGCECKIQVSDCQREGIEKCPKNHNTCHWETWRHQHGGCQVQHTVCMPQAHGHCDWNKSRSYRACIKETKAQKERQRELEP